MRRLRSRSGRADLRGWITPEDLNVAPALLGLPLATPQQRLVAMGIDLLLLSLLASLANLWLLAAPALAIWLRLRARRPGLNKSKLWLGWALVIFLAWLGLSQAYSEFTEASEPKTRAQTAELHAAAEPAAEPAPEASAAASSAGETSDAQRVAELEEEVAKLRHSQFDVKSQLKAWTDELGLRLGWAIAYFSLLPMLWPGQTVGKRLLGLKVVELTGKPMTLMQCLKRYGGYAAGISTGMLGFAQLLWDPNRQAIQDKTAHTVVLNTRRRDRLPISAWQDAQIEQTASGPAQDPASAI
jgi:hypothetical protein